jgi:hypothetical protein
MISNDDSATPKSYDRRQTHESAVNELDPSETTNLHELLVSVDTRSLTVDLSGLTVIDSSGIDVLLRTMLKHDDQGVRVFVEGPVLVLVGERGRGRTDPSSPESKRERSRSCESGLDRLRRRYPVHGRLLCPQSNLLVKPTETFRDQSGLHRHGGTTFSPVVEQPLRVGDLTLKLSRDAGLPKASWVLPRPGADKILFRDMPIIMTRDIL